jgi:5-methyltetrahydrofolate--homocysteine methyltransferase
MDWKTRLRENGVLISDGAWGTELAKLGLEPGTAPELWNAENPDAIGRIARGYLNAGSDIILTNSFGGSRWKLEKAGLADRTVELNRRAAEISKLDAEGRGLVFASVGPTGEFMAPLGTKAEEEFIACFTEQIEALLAGGADGIVLETFTDLGEIGAALKAARAAGAATVVASMTFDKGPAGYATMMGVKPEQAAAALDAAGADIVGSNCGSGIDNMIEVTGLLRSATERPLWIKSNAGQPELVDGQTVFRETPEQMASKVPALLEAGANIVGGCCGTTPEHIRQLGAAARAFVKEGI